MRNKTEVRIPEIENKKIHYKPQNKGKKTPSIYTFADFGVFFDNGPHFVKNPLI